MCSAHVVVDFMSNSSAELPFFFYFTDVKRRESPVYVCLWVSKYYTYLEIFRWKTKRFWDQWLAWGIFSFYGQTHRKIVCLKWGSWGQITFHVQNCRRSDVVRCSFDKNVRDKWLLNLHRNNYVLFFFDKVDTISRLHKYYILSENMKYSRFVRYNISFQVDVVDCFHSLKFIEDYCTADGHS